MREVWEDGLELVWEKSLLLVEDLTERLAPRSISGDGQVNERIVVEVGLVVPVPNSR